MLIGFASYKAVRTLQSMMLGTKLQGKEEDNNYKDLSCRVTLDVKEFRSQCKGKHSTVKELQGLALLDTLVTSRNGDRKIMRPTRIITSITKRLRQRPP